MIKLRSQMTAYRSRIIEHRSGMIVKNISSQRIRLFLVSGVLAVSCLVLLLAPLAVWRWVEQTPFPGFLLDPNLVVSGGVVDESWQASQMEPPVAFPARVTAVNGLQPESNRAFWSLLRHHGLDSQVEISFEVAVDAWPLPQTDVLTARTESFTLTPFVNSSLWVQFWLPYLVSLVTLGMGLWVFWSRPQAESVQIFVLFVSLGAILMAGLFDQAATQYFLPLWGVALPTFGLVNLFLVAIFPHEIQLLQKWPYWRWLFLLFSTGLAGWVLWAMYGDPNPWGFLAAWRVSLAISGLALLSSIFLIIYRTRWSPSPLVRQQGRVVTTGAIIAFGPLLLFIVTSLTPLNISWVQPEFFIPPLLAYPLVIGYALASYRMVDIEAFLEHRLAATLLTGVLVAALTLILVGMSTAVFGRELFLNYPLLLVLLVVLIALIFDPVRRRLPQLLGQLGGQGYTDYESLLRAYNRELTTAVHMEQVIEMLLGYARKALPSAQAHLYLYDPQTAAFSLHTNGRGEGETAVSNPHNGQIPPLPVAQVAPDSPVAAFLRQHDDIVDLTDERIWPEPLLAQRQQVQSLQAELLVPIQNGQDLFGWMAIRPTTAHAYLQMSDLRYLQTLADQALLGLERANVVQRLEQRVAELDRLSQFSRTLNFTIILDDMLEVTYTNYERHFDLDDFIVLLWEAGLERIYPVFYLEDGERLLYKEGTGQLVSDPRLETVVRTGQQQHWVEENGCFSIAAPLNAGANTLGVVLARSYHHTLNPYQQDLFMTFTDQVAIALERLLTDEALKKRAQQLEIINEVTLSLTSTLDLEPLLNLILDKSMDLLDTEAGTFMLVMEGTRELEFSVVRGPASKELLGARIPVGTGLAGTVAQTGRPLIVNQAHDDARWFASIEAQTDYQTNAILTVPLLRQSSVLGVVQLINKRNGFPFVEEDERLLTAFASQAVVALENARLLQQTDRALQDRVTELFMLQQLDRDLNTTLDLRKVLSFTIDWMLRVCQGTAGAIVLVDENGIPHTREMRGYESSFDPEELDGRTRLTGLMGHVLNTGQPHVSGNVHEEEHYVAASYATHSQMTLPIIHKQTFIGAISIESDRFDAFDTELVEMAYRATNHAAANIANALLYQQVHEANLAKSEFVSMVSHELKTPMTSMRGYVDLLLSGMTGEMSEQQRHFLETVSSNLHRMGRQIQDLTDISRIETGRMLVTLESTALSAVVSETLRTIQGLADQKGIRLRLDLPPDLPPVMADKERLVQVLTNLLSNACKYSPPETDVTVRFRSEQRRLQKKKAKVPVVTCSVQDNGHGISEADQKLLFTKFFRAEDPKIRQAPGTGLGLSITRGIIDLHDGEIWVESKLGVGTTFHFAIPCGPH
jgi:signal transduction histidine kinase